MRATTPDMIEATLTRADSSSSLPWPMLAVLAWRSLVQARYVLLASLFLLAAFQMILVGQASALEEAHSFGRMAEFVPAFLQRGLGSQSMLLVSFKGTVALGYFHPVVAILVSVLAIYFATEPAHEVEAGLVDLVLARAVPRRVIVTRSLLLSAGAILAAVTLMAMGTRLGLWAFASPEFDPPSSAAAARMLLHLAAVAACFAAFALVVSTGAKRWSTSFTSAAIAAVVLYFIDFIALGWPPLRTIAWISPFHYYPALSILSGTAPAFRNLAILSSAAAVLAALAYMRFDRRDL